jgi:GNAT superfamily N-acetyltransferase
MVEFKVIDFDEWRQRMQPLWPWNNDWHWIPIINNPYGQIQYTGCEAFKRVIMFPVMCTVNGTPAAYTSVFNISDTHLRLRGVYTEPEFRGQGLVAPMLDWACNLFPEPWHTAIGYGRETSLDYFLKVWFDEVMPNYSSRRRYEHSAEDLSNGDPTVTLMRRKFRDIS